MFGFHSKCKRVCLTHHVFADDLFIFTKGSEDSVNVHKVLQLFHSFSGLQMNCSKSEMFVHGISHNVIEVMKSSTGFSIGTLLVRYLGVPLVSKCLALKDCKPLVNKIVTY